MMRQSAPRLASLRSAGLLFLLLYLGNAFLWPVRVDLLLPVQIYLPLPLGLELLLRRDSGMLLERVNFL